MPSDRIEPLNDSRHVATIRSFAGREHKAAGFLNRMATELSDDEIEELWAVIQTISYIRGRQRERRVQ